MSRRAEVERKYGMKPGDYDYLDRMGRGLCWICEQPETVPNRSLAIDHDHETGSVRGLLCTRCNQVLGRMRDNAKWLRNAAEYLDKSREAFSDGCMDCLNGADPDPEWMVAPAVIVKRDEFGVRFGYECKVGHRWLCWHNTIGMPWAWSQ